MPELNTEALSEIAIRVRQNIINMSTNGGSFIGASLSAVEIITYLYTQFLKITPENLKDPDRNYFFISKGHAVPVIYSTFAEIGLLDKTRLRNHLKTNDYIYWHPNRNVPGIEFHSGSLGHLLSVAMGVALDCKINGINNKIVVMLGDGELNEGSNWEAIQVAHSLKLDNLIVVIDRNGFQANFPTEELSPLEPLDEKFIAFGWGVNIIDGHDFIEIDEAFASCPTIHGKPSVIIAKTIRGKGVPSIEAKSDKWFCNFSAEELAKYSLELEMEYR